jgi:hypothetical protein
MMMTRMAITMRMTSTMMMMTTTATTMTRQHVLVSILCAYHVIVTKTSTTRMTCFGWCRFPCLSSFPLWNLL